MSGVSSTERAQLSLFVREFGHKEGPEERELPWPGPTYPMQAEGGLW